MSQRSLHLSSPIRAVLALFAVVLLGGCVSYYERHYSDPGVYYGGGYETVRYRPTVYSVNPVHYPYWSLDYFYFSRYYHPYSVFVGYHEPLFYPYPGWAFGGRYAAHRYGYRVGYRGGLGFGYPWYGHGHFYPSYSLGFFVGYGHYGGGRHHGGRSERLRRIDRRLHALQDPAPAPSRTRLVERERAAGIPLGRSTGARTAIRSSAPGLRSRDEWVSRGALLDERSQRRSDAASAARRGGPETYRGGNEARIDRRRAIQSQRSSQVPPRDSSRDRALQQRGVERARAPAIRGARPDSSARDFRPNRSAPQIRRAPDIRSSGAIQERRSIRSAPPPAARPRAAEPPRSRGVPRARQESRQRPPAPQARARAPSRSGVEQRSRIRDGSGGRPRDRDRPRD